MGLKEGATGQLLVHMYFLVGFNYVNILTKPSRIPHAQRASTGTCVDQKTGICLVSAKCRQNLKVEDQKVPPGKA